ncbi:MAG: hypothetical protein H0U71_06895 [Gammaproteobacteria bacterium]|nr:hypothetical protein [Gammaproteobacteria bacterium]
MIRGILFLVGAFFTVNGFADSLYQADVGGYSSGAGVGLGVGVGSAGVPYTAQSGVPVYGGYGPTPGAVRSAIPYDNFTYPYGSDCCGCNRCNNCETGYGDRR